MRKKITFFSVMSVMAVCFLAGCAHSPDKPISAAQVQEKNKEAFHTTTEYVKQEAQGYQKKMQTNLHHLQKKLEAVKKDIQK